MTEVVIIAAVIGSGMIALKFDSINLSRIFKKSPVSTKDIQNQETKMFFVSKKNKQVR